MAALAALTQLNSLSLGVNQIGDQGARAILDAWAKRPDLDGCRLDLRRNGDLSLLLPPEALDTNNASAILAAYKRFRQGAETQQALNEAKLLLVGDEEVGKTSLVRYLVDRLPRREGQDPTRGAAIRKDVDTSTWSEGAASGVRLNIWDFGGQVIQRGTHQYFLTRHSLYLLVLSVRTEDDNSTVFDWLRTIRNRAGDAPVIVVINKCDGDKRGPRLPEEKIKREHGVAAFVRTSCDPGDEPAAAIQALR